MNTPKRHHEIPQMLLRNFVDERGLLHCYRKQEDRIFESTPENVFARRRLYSKRGHDGMAEDASKEHELAVRIEGPAKPVVEKIVTRARARKLPELSREEKYAGTCSFAFNAGGRHRARRDLENSDLVKWAIDEVERMAGPLSGEERATIDGTPERRRAAVGEAWIDTLTLPMGDLFEALRNKGLHVFVIEDPESALVIGDDPIVPMIPAGATLNHADAANLFPVARDVAVACSGGYLDEELGLVPGGSDGARPALEDPTWRLSNRARRSHVRRRDWSNR